MREWNPKAEKIFMECECQTQFQKKKKKKKKKKRKLIGFNVTIN